MIAIRRTTVITTIIFIIIPTLITTTVIIISYCIFTCYSHIQCLYHFRISSIISIRMRMNIFSVQEIYPSDSEHTFDNGNRSCSGISLVLRRLSIGLFIPISTSVATKI